MASLCTDQRQYLDALIAEHGEGKLQEYIDEKFTPTILRLRRMSPANAHTWIDLDAYVDWLIQDCQRRDRAPGSSYLEYAASSPPDYTSASPSVAAPRGRGGGRRRDERPAIDVRPFFRVGWPEVTWTQAKFAQPAEFSIVVRTMTGKNLLIHSLTGSTTVDQLKYIVQDKEGIPPDEQRLGLEGVQMEGDRVLQDYGIREGSLIDLVFKLRGGKPIIYLFSPRSVEATVRLSLTRDWSLSAIYPSVPIADKDGGQTLEWKVQTRADGTLHELNTALDVSYLFWEALTNKVVDSPPSSPVIGQAREVFRPGVTGVSNEDSVLLPVANVTQYLDQVLAALGLHVEARTSFITYWLPDMLKHTHVALRFLDQVAYAHAAPLDVSPNPDVVTRVFMLFCGVKKAELGEWEGAQAKAADSIDMWREIVGVNLGETLDESLFRVIEWGGMEVFH
ncbi:hypothetical protein GGF50DRAFT_89030 [Schizophyllum commune]